MLTFAMADPTNVPALDDIARMTEYDIEPLVASERTLEDAISHYHGPSRPS